MAQAVALGAVTSTTQPVAPALVDKVSTAARRQVVVVVAVAVVAVLQPMAAMELQPLVALEALEPQTV